MLSVELPELNRIQEKLDLISNLVEDLRHRRLPEWIDLDTACELKGIKKKTVQNNPRLQPDLKKE